MITKCFFALKLLGAFIHDQALKHDIIRYVESEYDYKTGEERITYIYEKGENPLRKSNDKPNRKT